VNLVRRTTRVAAAALVALLAVVGPAGGAGAVEGPIEADRTDDNEAVAVNTTDGASVFRLAFSIVKVADGVVDQENLAVAYASCTDCRTVALAFQVVIVMGDADYVAPVNQAGALNDQCVECLTFASATQIVLRVDHPVTLSPEGWRRAALLAARMAALEGQIDTLTAAQVAAEVSAIEKELLAILDEELVPVGSQGRDRDTGAGGPTTTAAAPVTTTTSLTQTSTSTPGTTTPATPSTTVAPPPTTTAPTAPAG
jgi:putative peptide zinc metalloprotease protein